jgi:hypothetical protein
MGKQSRRKNLSGKPKPLKGLNQRNSIRKEREMLVTINDLLKIDTSKESIAKNEIMFRVRIGFSHYKQVLEREEDALLQKQLFIVSILNTIASKKEVEENKTCSDFCNASLTEDFNLGDLKNPTTKAIVEGLYSLLLK